MLQVNIQLVETYTVIYNCWLSREIADSYMGFVALSKCGEEML